MTQRFLRVRATDVPVEPVINDIPCGRVGAWSGTWQTQLPIDDFAESPRLDVSLVVGVAGVPGGTTSDVDPGTMKAEGPSVHLVQVASEGAGRRTFPFTVTAQHALSSVKVRPPWVAARELREGWEDAAWRYASELHGLLGAGRVEEFAQAHTRRFEHVAATSGVPAAELRRDFTAFLRQLLQDAAWELSPLRRSETAFRLVARGRMCEFLNRDWAPTLRFRRRDNAPGLRWIAVRVGMVDGGWSCLA